MFLLLVICAVVASLYRFSGYAFVIVGIPILVHTVASYMLHGLKWSGWFCLGLGMLTATLCALGCIIYDNIRAERTNDITDWAADILLAILTGVVAGFIPYILEFWVRLVFDRCVWIGRLVTGWGK